LKNNLLKPTQIQKREGQNIIQLPVRIRDQTLQRQSRKKHARFAGIIRAGEDIYFAQWQFRFSDTPIIFYEKFGYHLLGTVKK